MINYIKLIKITLYMALMLVKKWLTYQSDGLSFKAHGLMHGREIAVKIPP